MDLNEQESEQSASAKLTPSPDPSLPADSQESSSSETSSHSLIVSFPAWFSRQPTHFNDVADPLTVKAGPPAVMIGSQQISGAPDFPAKTSQSLEREKDSEKESDPSLPSPSLTLWNDSDLGGSCWKTSQVSTLPTMEGTSSPSSMKWTNSGMVFRGEVLMHDSSESPRDAVEYSLSRVLEATAPERFFLSAKAAVGILRRAGRRGKKLPDTLNEALTSLALSSPDTTRELPVPLKTGNSSSLVRRLTPVECERLMGWPDGWTVPDQAQRAPRSRRKKTLE